MKKIILLLISACGIMSAYAQAPVAKNYATDADLSRWVLDVNFLGGGYTQQMQTPNTPGYLNGVNINAGTLGFKNGMAMGGDAQIGFFFGKNRHWGIGTGLMYLRESGDVTLDNFHAEYQSTDAAGNIFRQVVTGNNIDEQVKIDNFNIPLVLKYKKRFSKHWGFTGDAGLLFNLQMKNEYKTNASLDYEAIYKFTNNGDGSQTAVYDNSPTPANGDFLITKDQYLKNNQDGNVQNYFNTKSGQGYSVGLGVNPNHTTGSVSYATGSVGFLFQPSVNYFFSDKVALNLGGYYLYQPFNNTVSSGYTLTNKPGDYSSVLNSESHTTTQSYGLNLGLRFFLGRKQPPLKITSIDPIEPTQCGLCDGGMVLHGLRPGKPVTVNYSKDGIAQTAFTGNVEANGSVKIPALCAGAYTGIDAKMHRRSTSGNPVTLVPPPTTISSENASNPSAPGACDGTITINGLNAGQTVVINSMRNGTPQPSTTVVVPAGRSIVLTGLCEGSYTGIMVNGAQCAAISSANGADITLTAPAPPPPPAPVVVEEKIDISTPILFDFNKITVHRISYPVLEEAAKEMNEDKSTTITINGYTDIVGSSAYNKTLSIERGNSVKNQLVKMGVSPRRMKVVGHGKKSPVGDNSTPEGRDKNRRAVMNKN